MSPDEDEDSGADSLNEQISKINFLKLKSAFINFKVFRRKIQCYISVGRKYISKFEER